MPTWPQVVNLKADPHEKGMHESEMYLRWYAENTMWTFVPVQQKLKEFISTLGDYPFQQSSSLSVANFASDTLVRANALRRPEALESTMRAPRQFSNRLYFTSPPRGPIVLRD